MKDEWHVAQAAGEISPVSGGVRRALLTLMAGVAELHLPYLATRCRAGPELLCCCIHRVLVLLLLVCFAGCASSDGGGADSVGQAWVRQGHDASRQPDEVPGPSSAGGRSDATGVGVGDDGASLDSTVHGKIAGPRGTDAAVTPEVLGDMGATAGASGPIATVDGQPIARHRVVDLLLRSHGPGVLEQLIVHDAATRLASERGLTVDRADIDREYELALRRLVDPLGPITEGPVDRDTGERLLDSVLSERNISREEFRITLRRNAYLRKLVEADQVFTEEQLRAEFDRRFGRRFLVRHIQLPTSGGVTRIQERLAGGEDFAELARTHSVNQATAGKGGLLEPFSETDEEVPAPIRRQAALLRPGEVSGAVRVGAWYHVLKLEKVLAAAETDYEAVRGDLEAGLRERLAEPTMRELYERLFREASIEIHDPTLRQTFERTHPEHGR